MKVATGLVFLLSFFALPSYPDVLDNFRQSTIRSQHGEVSEVEFSTGVVLLEPGMLAHHLPQAMKDFQFAEPVWVVGYRTDIVDALGKPLKDNYLCHTFFSDERVAQHEENELRGIYSDAFTPEVRVPEGFGISIPADQRFHWMPMFNNRSDEPARVRMTMRISVIRAKDMRKPLRPLYASLRSVESPHLFFVEPGRDERKSTFQLPFNGRIHFLGTHVHPYAVSIELFNVTRGERVWKALRQGGPLGAMGVFSSAQGTPIRAGDVYRITAVYDNSTGARIDAMAGLFMLYSRE